MNHLPERGTVLITGATSSIGSSYAARLARRGHDLILVAQDSQRLDALVARVEADTLAMIEGVAADLSNPNDLLHVSDILRSDTSICMLVNAAGLDLPAAAATSGLDVMHETIAIDIAALTRLTYAATARFCERGSGTIINVCSIVPTGPASLIGMHDATKAYVQALCHALDQECAHAGVRVQVLLPAAVSTAVCVNPEDSLGATVTERRDTRMAAAQDAVLRPVRHGSFSGVQQLLQAE